MILSIFTVYQVSIQSTLWCGVKLNPEDLFPITPKIPKSVPKSTRTGPSDVHKDRWKGPLVENL